MVLFIWERWRYDLVAMGALLVLTVLGIVPAQEAFLGFGHPAVITVAAVLILSHALATSGVVYHMARPLKRFNDRPLLQLGALVGVTTVVSAFVNNVGALALMMPVVLRIAHTSGRSPSKLLMPVAFGSLLGGMTTLIGTPPNIIIGSFRAETDAQRPFTMFDFAPVGMMTAAVGCLYLIFLGWRFLPNRPGASGAGSAADRDVFQIGDYTTELQVAAGSRVVGRPISELPTDEVPSLVVLSVTRSERRLLAPSGRTVLQAGDRLMVEIDPIELDTLLTSTGFQLAGAGELTEIGSDEVRLLEAVVVPGSLLEDRSAGDLRLRSRHGVNLLAVARQGSRVVAPLASVVIRPGDVLLMQCAAADAVSTLQTLGAMPLSERELPRSGPRRLIPVLTIFVGAVVALVSGFVPAAVAFSVAALALAASGLLRLRELYDTIEWPVVVLLAAMIPVGNALQATGGASRIATWLAEAGTALPPAAFVALLMIVTMFLSDVMNNAAPAVVMAPIAIGVAAQLDVSADPLLMAVAVGASCAFLTPIGHQSNTLIMGPGGYRFGDFWKMGLPLEILIVLVGVPAILWAWPL
ncbi:MAG: SLC13 family permease [Acidobacteriota bacterium]